MTDTDASYLGTSQDDFQGELDVADTVDNLAVAAYGLHWEVVGVLSGY